MTPRFFCVKFGYAVCAALTVVMLLSTTLNAQQTRGAISGTVRDEQGSAVSGATVKITDPRTNITRDAITNEDGFYRIAALEPGAAYTLVIEKAGFSKAETREIAISQATETTVDVSLKVGNVVETVDVTAQTEAITLNKTNPTIGLTVTARQAVELPLGAGRNVNNLALLSPNVFTAPGSSGISANGQRARNNNFTIDGSDNNDISVTIPTSPVIPEAVAEFQVQTNAYSVEFGRNSGAQINVITRSGSNAFHADVWDYYRGSRLNALDNIEKTNGLERPSRFNRNQFGFDINGPVLLPGFFGEGTGKVGYDGRDRTFFFYLYQGDRTRTGASLGPNIRIPTPAGFATLQSVPLRAGQSAASRQAVLNSIGFLQGIYGQGIVFRSLRNDIVNGVNVQTGLTNVPIIQNTDIYNNTLRVDHKISDSDNFTARYIANKPTNADQISNTQFGTLFSGDQVILDQNAALSETHVFNPNLLNEFRFSYIRRNLAFPENDPNTPATAITGLFSIGGASNFPQGRIQNSYQYSDTLSWLVGRHSLKFGADIRRIQLFNIAAFDSKGTFQFSNLQNFINNQAQFFQQALQTATFDARQTQQFYFIQDDFRVTPNLTLNLGLRYETYNLPFGLFGATDAQSRAALVPGPTARDNNNFAPAFGFAYSPRPEVGLLKSIFGDGLSSIRGGYRINYDQIFFNILTVNASNFPRVVVPRIDNAVDVFPNLLPVSGAAVFNPLATFVNTPEDAETPYSQLYSLSWQRELLRNYVFEVGYSGSRALNQINQLQGNPAILTAAQAATVASSRNELAIPSVQARRVSPQFGSRVLIATTAQSTYNSGFVRLDKRLSDGLQFGVAYTFSKLMSNNDESLGVGAITTGSPQIPQDYLNITAEKSLSAFDRRHRLVANFLYEVPLIPGQFFKSGVGRQIFGGWEISGIVTRQSGQPFTILTGVDSNGNGAGGDRPNVNPDRALVLDPVTGDLRTFSDPNGRYFVPRGANGLPLNFSLGNGSLGRNTLRGPGFYNTDLSLQKRISMPWENHRLILRGDFLNLFNQDNYGNPVNNMSSTDFGRNLNNWGNRSITVSAKYSF